MTNHVDLLKYAQFVEGVTSGDTNFIDNFMQRIGNLRQENPDVNLSVLLNSAIGLPSEAGEYSDILKKVFFQGKPLDDEIKTKLKRELGDVIWYWVNACRALGFDPNEVISDNVGKLESRYPGGTFDVSLSENRKLGDD